MVLGITNRRSTLTQNDAVQAQKGVNNASSQGEVRRESGSSIDTLADGSVNSREILETPALRINTIKKIINYYINYFNKFTNIEMNYIKTMRKLVSSADPLDRGSSGKKLSEKTRKNISLVNEMFLPPDENGVANLANQIKDSQTRKLDSQEEMVTRIKTNILPNLVALNKQVKKYISSYYKAMEKVYKKMRNQNKLVEKNFLTTYKSIQENKIKRGDIDPFIAKIELEKSINTEKEIEIDFHKDLDVELAKIKIWEAQIIDQIKINVNEYYTVKTHELTKEQDAFKSSFEKMNSFNYENEWNKFESKLKKDMKCYSAINCGHFDRIKAINIESSYILSAIAQGPIQMKSGFISSFSSFYAILTQCKYLHLFKSSESYSSKDKPLHSFYLPSMDLLHKDSKGNYGLYTSNSGIFKSSKHVFNDPQKPIIIMSDIGSIKKTSQQGSINENWHSIIYELLVKERGEAPINRLSMVPLIDPSIEQENINQAGEITQQVPIQIEQDTAIGANNTAERNQGELNQTMMSSDGKVEVTGTQNGKANEATVKNIEGAQTENLVAESSSRNANVNTQQVNSNPPTLPDYKPAQEGNINEVVPVTMSSNLMPETGGDLPKVDANSENGASTENNQSVNLSGNVSKKKSKKKNKKR
ncbi:hypothetical protein AYI70_g3423 [Smittium culicis]|uniref:Uncharacterized protein n=1 Tax=Smittium culicis TaxID=133412 RepID=A0A1R1Y3Z5_9FUNG|nr:hypothetical protein AYI70_g3423 [Smittium culicis]